MRVNKQNKWISMVPGTKKEDNMDFNTMLGNYADVIVTKGISMKKGQKVEINASLENRALAILIMEKAFSRGAANVVINWVDYEAMKIKFMMAPKKVFDKVEAWEQVKNDRYKPEEWCLIYISTPSPEVFKDVDPSILGKALKARAKAFEKSTQLRMSMDIKWCTALSVTLDWAKKVFPECNNETAVRKLWDYIFKCTRVDQANYIELWDKHLQNLVDKYTILNNKKYIKLRYVAPGTDFEIKPFKGANWVGGGTKAYDGTIVVPNMPTEEVFSVPNKYSANGKVSSTLPLVYGGNVIKNLWFEFKDGMVTDFGADEGKEVIEKFLETDEGAKYLGEIALVPVNSPISQLNTIFFDTLYDENASCHLALGNGVSMCAKEVTGMTKKEKSQVGFNDSMVHLDFMIGSNKLNITGTLPDGTEEPIFINGEWA